MINYDEFKNIQVGDYIQIVDKWNSWSNANSDGCIDYLLGKTFPVSTEATAESVARWGNYLLKIKRGVMPSYWSLNRFCIEKVVKKTKHKTNYRHFIRKDAECIKMTDNIPKEYVRDYLKSYGDFLKYKRIKKNCTQLEVANAIGISQAIISHIECGFMLPPSNIEKSILEYLS